MVNVYNWVVSFKLPMRRLTQYQRSALKKSQYLRIRTLIAKQMTDAEKLTITTIDTSLTADMIDNGAFKLSDLKASAPASPALRQHTVPPPAFGSCDICAIVRETLRSSRPLSPSEGPRIREHTLAWHLLSDLTLADSAPGGQWSNTSWLPRRAPISTVSQ
jgi:hypothetical protein